MHALTSLIRRFSRDQRGNVAIIFGMSLALLLSAVGAGIDYSLATRMKAKLQSAADAAAVAAISVNSPGYLQASLTGVDGPVPNGVADADSVFKGVVNNLKDSMQGGFSGLTESSTVTKTGPTLTSVVTFTARVPTTFMNIFGFANMTVGGSSSATGSLPPYLDFYLLLDVSGSMGLPSTSAEAVRMQNINPDNYKQYPTGCTLACHFAGQNSACTDSGTQRYKTSNYCMGYVYSRLGQTALAALINQASTVSVPKQKPGLPTAMLAGLNTNVPTGTTNPPNSLIAGNTSSLPYSLPAVTSCDTAGTNSCIQLRLDAVGVALNLLFQEAKNDKKVTDQFRIGLFPFITDVYNYFALTTDFETDVNGTNPSTINYAAKTLATLLDTNTNANLGSGGTHIENALSQMNTKITTVGTGTSTSNRQPYVFLVTDGAVDPQMKAIGGGWSGSNHATVIDPTKSCQTIKNRNIVISVLYIPYQKIDPVNTSFAGDEDDYANWNIPNIPASLQGCASPGYFYTANTPQDINDAMVKMFKHVLQSAHITN